MEVLVLMVFVSIALALVFLGLFIQSTRSGQFEEGESPAVRILFENHKKESKSKNSSKNE